MRNFTNNYGEEQFYSFFTIDIPINNNQVSTLSNEIEHYLEHHGDAVDRWVWDTCEGVDNDGYGSFRFEWPADIMNFLTEEQRQRMGEILNEVVGSTFYCENKGANPKRIFKSRVSDGICDCCDGSDENGIGCSNTCLEDGKAWREERIRQAAHIRQGIVVKETYVELGKAKILEIEEKRKILENELNNLHSLTSELENNKLIMEQKETEEKRKYQLLFKVDHASILKRSRILEVLNQFTKDDGNLGDDIVGDGNVVATNQDEHKDDYKVDDFGKDLLQFALKNNVMSQFREFLLERLPSNANERNTLPLPNNVDTSSSNNEINQLDDDIQEQLNTMLKETEGEGMEDIRQEAIVSLHF